jgi:hypothetical protein
MHDLPSKVTLTTAMHSQLSAFLSPHHRDDIHSNACKNRIISSYIQLIWNGKIAKHHPIYDVIGLPLDAYLAVVRFRTLNIRARVYTLPRSDRAIPYSARICPFGCREPADVEHVVLRCSHTRLDSAHNNISAIFANTDAQYLHQLAIAIHGIMEKLHDASTKPTCPTTGVADATVLEEDNDMQVCDNDTTITAEQL